MRTDTRQHAHLIAASLLWLLAGTLLLASTLVPAHTVVWGWTPAFWLIGAPLAVLLVLEPRLPGHALAALRRRRRPTAAQLIWN